MNAPALGFIGFGEAAFWIARGLAGQGIKTLLAYDLHTTTPTRGELIRQRALEAGVSLMASYGDIAAHCDIIISAVPADAAQVAAENTAGSLNARHVYVDINSVSPAVKQAVATAITRYGARFVEAAVMSTVPPLGHRVPMLLAGPDAYAFSSAMTRFGMQFEVLEGPIGSAAAIKMCRSIIIKGLEALMLECVMGAEAYGAAEKVFATVTASIPGIDWNKLAHYMIGRTALHAQRRVHEMEESARMLTDLGIEPIMASATARRIQTCADLDLKAQFQGKEPAHYADVVRALQRSQTK